MMPFTHGYGQRVDEALPLPGVGFQSAWLAGAAAQREATSGSLSLDKYAPMSLYAPGIKVSN